MLVLRRLKKCTNAAQKIRVLKENDSPILRKLLLYTLNKEITYGISPTNVVEWPRLEEPEESMFDLLDLLAERLVVGNLARHNVDDYVHNNGDLLLLVLSRKLECGVSVTIVNKAFPNLIPVFAIQLAKAVPIQDIPRPTIAQIKYDGVRIIIIKRYKSVEFRTRNNKLVHLPKLAEILMKVTSSFFLDTEITVLTGLQKDRSKVSGMINSAIHGNVIDESTLRLNVFDCLTLEEWDTKVCTREYHRRLDHLFYICDSLKNDQLIPAISVSLGTVQDIELYYMEALDSGFEGLILKSAQHKYTFRRTKDWAKLKESKTADLLCVDTREGKGKHTGKVGALVCKGYVEGKHVSVDIGSGLSDVDRDRIDFVGMTIEVKYNCVVSDSVGNYSLFIASFVCSRFDK